MEDEVADLELGLAEKGSGIAGYEGTGDLKKLVVAELGDGLG